MAQPRNTSRIIAQPAQLQSHKKTQKYGLDSQGAACDCKGQPRSKHCSTLQKGIGMQSIAASRLSIRVMRSHNSKSLNAWGRNTDTQNDYKLIP